MTMSVVPLTMSSSRFGLENSPHITLDETVSGRAGNAAKVPLRSQNAIIYLKETSRMNLASLVEISQGQFKMPPARI
jgi:hypothetical protein